MIRIVKNSKHSDIKESLRFDSRYYYLGEVLNKTLSRFEVKPLTSFTRTIRKGIFDLNSRGAFIILQNPCKYEGFVVN